MHISTATDLNTHRLREQKKHQRSSHETNNDYIHKRKTEINHKQNKKIQTPKTTKERITGNERKIQGIS